MDTPDPDVQWLRRTSAALTPRLPVELVREIVDIALIQDPTTVSNLALVCKEVYRWMIPIIFRTIWLTWEEDKRGLRNMIADETRDLVTHVQNLHLTFPELDDVDDTYAINNSLLSALSRCTCIQRLVIDCSEPDEFIDKQVADFRTFSGPWDVRIPVVNPSRILKLSNVPYLRNVTHFYCGDGTEFICGIGIAYCAFLPHVTHLAFAVADIWGDRPRRVLLMVKTFETLQKWLARPSLKMLYVEYREWNTRFKNGILDNNWDRMITIKDERLFIGSGLDKDFQHLTEDGIAVWDRVTERFGNWRVTVGDAEHRHEESNSNSNSDSDSEIYYSS